MSPECHVSCSMENWSRAAVLREEVQSQSQVKVEVG